MKKTETSLRHYLTELKSLNLPVGKFAIFGSGPMAVRKIRQARDLDVIVKKDLWHNLVQKFPLSRRQKNQYLKIGNLEIYYNWFKLSNEINEMIDNADIIDDFPFVKLEYVLAYKKELGRKKDIADIKLIEALFLKKQHE